MYPYGITGGTCGKWWHEATERRSLGAGEQGSMGAEGRGSAGAEEQGSKGAEENSPQHLRTPAP